MVHNWASPMASEQAAILPFQWAGRMAAFLVRDLLAEPVFVLCAARSGSTSARFLLDAHPA